MNPEHPKWGEFLDRLEGPEGCNFRQEDGTFRFDCTSETEKRGARAALAAMGFTDEAIEASCAYFEEHGGYCDCEILLNISFHEEVHPAINGDRDPATVRRMFKHLDDGALLKVADSLRAPDGILPPVHWGAAVAVALMQRGYEDALHDDLDAPSPCWDAEMPHDSFEQLQSEFELEIMTPEHARWNEFLDRMEGPEGCYCREGDMFGRYVYECSCSGDHDLFATCAILKHMGFCDEEIDASCDYFEEHGAICDCDVLSVLGHEPQIQSAFGEGGHPNRGRRLFKHLTDETIRRIVRRLCGADPDGSDYTLHVFCLAQGQRDGWSQGQMRVAVKRRGGCAIGDPFERDEFISREPDTRTMTPEHPRWNEFLSRLEGPEGCNFREHDHGLTYDSPDPDRAPFARIILRRMGFTPEAIEASCQYFDKDDRQSDDLIVINMGHLPDVEDVLQKRRDPKDVRRLFNHLSDDTIKEMARRRGIDPDDPAYHERTLITIACLQRGIWGDDLCW